MINKNRTCDPFANSRQCPWYSNTHPTSKNVWKTWL